MPCRFRSAITRPIALALCLTGLLGPFSLGCSQIPAGRTVVDDVQIHGTRKLDEADVRDKIATAPSQKFLGLFQGVYDYQIFTQATLQRDLARIERFYQARGYYNARARAGRVIQTQNQHVRVEILVEEGEPVVTTTVTVTGIDALPPALKSRAVLAATTALPIGTPFDEEKLGTAVAGVKAALTDGGYAFATVTDDAFVDIVHEQATVTIAVVPGEPASFGKIEIVGLDPDGAKGARRQELPEKPLRDAMALEEGKPYSTWRIDAAKSALLDLGVFAAVTIEPDLSHPETHTVPLTVRVEPVKLRQVKLGGGIEFDGLKAGVHLVGGWEDHNFLGGLRTFSVDASPGIVLYPTRVTNITAPTDFFPEEKLRLQLKQPGFIESRTEGFVRAEANVFPLLVLNEPKPSDSVIGYGEVRGAVGVNRQFLRRVFASISHNVQYEDPFSYKNGLDAALRPLVISYPDLSVRLELVDDHKRPHSGVTFGNDLQVAGTIFGGNASDFKVQPEVRTYVPLGRKVTFATRASIGFLVSSNYGSTVQERLTAPVTAQNHDERVRDIETVLFRGLFSGGPSSNRGFPLRGVSPHGIVPFLTPIGAAQQAQSCQPPSAANGFAQPDPVACSVPIGGFTLWELSNELRFPIKGAFSGAVFCDMSDVSPKQTDLRFDHLHLSCGSGARYDTPVGPIRLDIGYRVQPLQVLGYKDETSAFNADATNGLQPTFFGGHFSTGIPIAIAIGIGEAY